MNEYENNVAIGEKEKGSSSVQRSLFVGGAVDVPSNETVGPLRPARKGAASRIRMGRGADSREQRFSPYSPIRMGRWTVGRTQSPPRRPTRPRDSCPLPRRSRFADNADIAAPADTRADRDRCASAAPRSCRRWSPPTGGSSFGVHPTGIVQFRGGTECVKQGQLQ